MKYFRIGLLVSIFYLCHVKFICLIFSFYVVLLSARPCCTHREGEGKVFIKKEQTAKPARKAKECQGCSPFFSCGSCLGFVVAKPFTQTMGFVAEKPLISYPPYQQPNLKEITLSIWQPPQIS